ncbi:MAG: DUF3368 domain-containing protein [Chloroflexi bacterium]|nr:DUF3368 domain-containing protein [Chloroflexota bacterium]
MPLPVVQEIVAGSVDDPARRFLKGETSVLSYALSNPVWTAILDNRAARKCAKSYMLYPMRGKLAIIILARKKGLLPSAKEGLLALQNAGMRFDDEIIRVALKRELGEDW